MKEIAGRHVQALAYLLSRGARGSHVRMTTSELGRGIHRSQQAASDQLRELELGGLIERMAHGRSMSVRVTPQGYAAVAQLYESLRACIESAPVSMDLAGRVVSGSGEGRYYMAQDGYTRQFRARMGYVPFPGTLNVSLDAGSAAKLGSLDPARGTLLDGFSDGQRTYGWVRCHGATINSRVPCDLLRLERTHHDGDIVELVSAVNLRKKMGVFDGSSVTISVAP